MSGEAMTRYKGQNAYIKLRLNYVAQGWSLMMLITELEEILRSLGIGRAAEPTSTCKNLEGSAMGGGREHSLEGREHFLGGEGALLGEVVAGCRWEGRAGRSCSGSL